MNMQHTNEWLLDRVGKVGASRVADIIARTKNGWSKSRELYCAELVCERMTGLPYPQYQSQAMAWGIEQEAAAASLYAVLSDLDVTECGFIPHPTIAMSGASPDRLVGADGLAEFKCPQTNTHLRTLLGEPIADEYMVQMQWQMACTGRKWCDWVSFDPRMPSKQQMHIIRVERSDWRIASLEKSVREFLIEVDRTIEQLEQRFRETA